jgi:hypothetical protein
MPGHAKKAKKILTTDELRQRLEAKYPEPEWVLLHEVRDSTGFEGQRSADCLALSTWPGRGISLYGFEIKASRGDVKKELKNPQKAEAMAKLCDRWYLVLGHASLIEESEVPKNWGVLVPHGAGLKIAQEAAKRERSEWRDVFVASLVRNAYQHDRNERDLRAEYEKGRKAGESQRKYLAERNEQDLKRIQAKVKEFEELSGVTVLSDRHGWHSKLKDQAGLLKMIMTSGVQSFWGRTSKLLGELDASTSAIRKHMADAGVLEGKPDVNGLCPHPARGGRHELYVTLGKRREKKGNMIPVHCRACGASGEMRAT